MIELTAELVIQIASEFYDECTKEGIDVTWQDYDRFKRMLIENGWYGYEGRLARALHL